MRKQQQLATRDRRGRRTRASYTRTYAYRSTRVVYVNGYR